MKTIICYSVSFHMLHLQKLAMNVTPNDVYEALSEELRYWKRKCGTQFQQMEQKGNSPEQDLINDSSDNEDQVAITKFYPDFSIALRREA